MQTVYHTLRFSAIYPSASRPAAINKVEEKMKTKNIYSALAALAGLVCAVCSCSTGEAAAQILGGSSQSPVFLACRPVSETDVEFQFSLPVKVVSLRLSPAFAVDSVQDGSTVRVRLGENPGPGEKLTADLLAEDERGNTINALVPFRTRNNRVPALRINELRTEYSKPRTEFIEFKILSAGNLAALRVYIASNNKNPLVYEFMPMEVGAGEYVVLHLRTLDELNRDETGPGLNESGGSESVAGARDLWVPGTAKLLRKTDVVYVLDQDDAVIDAVLLAENPAESWGKGKEHLADAADFLYKQGAWKPSGGPQNAVDTSTVKTAATKSVSRNENAPDTNAAADWHVTAASGATPGKPNK
jgi:hypothetical protein